MFNHSEPIYSPSIAVLGCGWLGLPLAQNLIQLGCRVNGSTTQNNKIQVLESLNINAYLLNFKPTLNQTEVQDFFDVEYLIINLPPKLSSNSSDYHLKQIQSILEFATQSQVKKIIFISSTSIYPELNKEVTEDDIQSETTSANLALFCAEEMIRTNTNFEHNILRCAGLTGYDRILVKHFAGKKNLEGGLNPVNMVHRDDVVSIIIELIFGKIWNDTFNVCSPIHPSREEFYIQMAERYNFPMPEFLPFHKTDFKIVKADKLCEKIGYTYKYPNPMEFDYL